VAIPKKFPDRASAFLAMTHLLSLPPEVRDEIRDAVRYYIAGLAPEAADAAMVELFNELEVYDDVSMEEMGFRRLTDEEIAEVKRLFGMEEEE
jgi:hypothetical protein